MWREAAESKRESTSHKCTLHMAKLKSTFEVDVASDQPEVDPPFFCNSCYAAVKRHSTASSEGIPYCHSIEVFNWEKYQEECAVCIIFTCHIRA